MQHPEHLVVLTVSWRGEFMKCSPSENTLLSARRNPSLPSVVRCVLLFSLIVSLYLSFGVFCGASPSFWHVFRNPFCFSTNSSCLSFFSTSLFYLSSPILISSFDLWNGATKMSADETTLSGFVSAFILIFVSKSLRDFIAICLSVYLVHWDFSLASVTHKRQSHSRACVGAAVHGGRGRETKNWKWKCLSFFLFFCLVIKYNLLWLFIFLECLICFFFSLSLSALHLDPNTPQIKRFSTFLLILKALQELSSMLPLEFPLIHCSL